MRVSVKDCCERLRTVPDAEQPDPLLKCTFNSSLRGALQFLHSWGTEEISLADGVYLRQLVREARERRRNFLEELRTTTDPQRRRTLGLWHNNNDRCEAALLLLEKMYGIDADTFEIAQQLAGPPTTDEDRERFREIMGSYVRRLMDEKELI